MAVAHVDFQNLPPSAKILLYKNGQSIQQLQATTERKPINIVSSNSNALVRSVDHKHWTDPRDQALYSIVKVGNQYWMGENFRYAQQGAIESKQPQPYGYFYNWEQALASCPEGWHLPTRSEWKTLFEHFGGLAMAAKALKADQDWKNHASLGTTTSLFNAYPAGEYQTAIDDIVNLGYHTYFWTANDKTGEIYKGERLGYYYRLSYSSSKVLEAAAYKEKYFSVRYIKDQ